MAVDPQDKIFSFEDLAAKVRDLKAEGKKVVLSHGVFDLIHPGIIQHLNSARSMGDVMIVTVIKDKDVRRGPGRPVFPEVLRLNNVASLAQVDYVCLVDDERPFECVRILNPDVFAKGQAHQERDQEVNRKIFEEERDLFWGEIQIRETDGFSMRSSHILRNFFDLYPEDTKLFLKNFFKRHTFKEIADYLHGMESLRVCLIGDGIIDEYHYCEPMGKAGKANLVVNRFLSHEVFAGGAFAIANHVAGLCKEVHLVTMLGLDNPRAEFIRDNLKPNVTTRFFYRDDGPTITKTRFVHQYLNQKLFEVNYINDTKLPPSLDREVADYLKQQVQGYDLVLLSDFGHGFVSEAIYRALVENSKVLAVNTQTNAANSGYNLITKYAQPHYVCLDEPEVRLAAQDKHGAIDEIALAIKEQIRANHLVVTLGKRGSLGVNGRQQVFRTPIFSTNVVDTIGAGDAYFAYTAPCVAQSMPMDMVTFVGNAVGALAVQIMGNKRSVEKNEVLELIHSLAK
ncbi:PfkB family carbohydrate kinase [Nitrospina gracilis]|uniref:PfkB family carbohydrate kinase n=1 Tax=Nitrospina gracilis TaxID=35801 RepID=UPI001F45BCE3|nr:PfkB family carbohydrate kinase [Nitrospina gracilis]MCF8719410.1 bifunctional ADP-heptose synthase (sugar kinase/adenylyltransferase) [Nitrospina gracilis Nb-211]